jgi:ecotin
MVLASVVVSVEEQEGEGMKAGGPIVVLSLFAAMSAVWAADNMKAFPPAEAGMVRHVLQLPEQKDEYAFKVELIVGKTVQLDEGNRYYFGGKIEEANIEGWGFTRYVVSKLGPMAGTLMAVDPDAPKVSRFITLGGEPYIIRYNSRLPVVVYAPEGVEVRYRIWSAAPETTAIEKG